MPNLDNRIIFDTKTGEIHHQTYEATGDVLPRKKVYGLDYLDIPFGSVDYSRYMVVGVDLGSKKPIFREFVIPQVEEPIAEPPKDITTVGVLEK